MSAAEGVSMTGAEHNVYLGYIEQFRAVHAKAAAQRDQRRAHETRTIDGHAKDGAGWVFFEAEQMLDRINALRAERGLAPATVADVHRAEDRATGHSDYARKYALYCADLAMGLR